MTLLSIFAHQLGLGPNPGFGWKKLLGTVIGIGLLIVGVFLYRAPTMDEVYDVANGETMDQHDEASGGAVPPAAGPPGPAVGRAPPGEGG